MYMMRVYVTEPTGRAGHVTSPKRDLFHSSHPRLLIGGSVTSVHRLLNKTRGGEDHDLTSGSSLRLCAFGAINCALQKIEQVSSGRR